MKIQITKTIYNKQIIQMKLSEFRKLIKEEVRKVLKEEVSMTEDFDHPA